MSSDALFVGGGVTAPAEARLASSGLLALQGPTPLDVRTGVLASPGSTALITGTTDTGQMTVQIGVHVTVTSRGNANGPYIGPTLEAQAKVTIAAAPSTGSRIDVVYAKQQDGNSGVPSPDTTTAPLYGVLQGVASSSPSKPDLSTIVGALELGTVQVAAGATSTNGAGVTITNTARQTVARGAPIPVRSQAERDALTTFPGMPDVIRLDVANGFRRERYTGSAWVNATPNPVKSIDLNAATIVTAPGQSITGNHLVDPTALFGSGFGAQVLISGAALVDTVAGTGFWYYNLNDGSGNLLQQDGANVAGRTVMKFTFMDTVAAGTTKTYNSSLTAPGVATSVQVKTYADPTSNRLAFTILPIFP